MNKHKSFQLAAEFAPNGDQPKAIDSLVNGIKIHKLQHQILLGVTGSGKTYTMANVIATLNQPALVMVHNKTLAAQIYLELKGFFPYNAVEYFVSYYDYYQPEAYVPHKDLYIEKDSSINEQIEQMRLSATKAVLDRQDVIVVATVSAIYGIGDKDAYRSMSLRFTLGGMMNIDHIIASLISMQYEREDSSEFLRGKFRVRGENIDIFPAENYTSAIRIVIADLELNLDSNNHIVQAESANADHHINQINYNDYETISEIFAIDPITNKKLYNLEHFTLFPASHYVAPKDLITNACIGIKAELAERIAEFKALGKFAEAARIEQRTAFDLEMLSETSFCKGIENYSRYLTNREAGLPPPTLLSYMPSNALLFIDESHITVPQIGAMYAGDRARKQNLVDYGFRLKSALDNRPLKFSEFEELSPSSVVYISATPGEYEINRQQNIAEQIVRPTGLLDPIIIVRPVDNQVSDLLQEIKIRTQKNERILVTTLTKRMAEKLTDYYSEQGIAVKYLHSEIDTLERVAILNALRLGECDVLIGINLLREGLDLPEVSLVAIFDADSEGFLRSTKSLIQTVGRAARNAHGMAIFYANKITKSMQETIDETNRRRQLQEDYNHKHGIVPKTIIKEIAGDLIDQSIIKNTKSKKDKKIKQHKQEDKDKHDQHGKQYTDTQTINKPKTKRIQKQNTSIENHKENDNQTNIKQLEKQMKQLIKQQDFEAAIIIRDRIHNLQLKK